MANPHYEGDVNSVIRADPQDPQKMIIPPRRLSIVWGNDTRYWKIPPSESSDPVELLQVSWLEVTVSVDIQSNKDYTVGFQLQLTPDAFGWSSCSLFIMTKRHKDATPNWKKINMDDKGESEFTITGRSIKHSGDETGDKLYFGLYEVWSGKWKGGLKICHAFFKEGVEGKT